MCGSGPASTALGSTLRCSWLAVADASLTTHIAEQVLPQALVQSVHELCIRMEADHSRVCCLVNHTGTEPWLGRPLTFAVSGLVRPLLDLPLGSPEVYVVFCSRGWRLLVETSSGKVGKGLRPLVC